MTEGKEYQLAQAWDQVTIAQRAVDAADSRLRRARVGIGLAPQKRLELEDAVKRAVARLNASRATILELARRDVLATADEILDAYEKGKREATPSNERQGYPW
jgi:hypothetical protein